MNKTALTQFQVLAVLYTATQLEQFFGR